MSINVDLATTTVKLGWDLNKEEPIIDIDVNVEDSNPFPVGVVLAGMVSALERAARQLNDQIDPADRRHLDDAADYRARLAAVEAWAAEQEIAAPPLAWDVLGAILHPATDED